MEERHLNFNNFINQRASQIIKFTQALQVNTAKRTYQSLPKSIRRRAMSHNRYRIPLRMRKPFLQELIKSQSMQKIPKFRKNIRKRHRLMLSYKGRSDNVQWLNTHLWAAKRMRMCQYAGFKISESPNNKSFRSAYRHYRHNACLMDYSYLQCLTIRMKNNEGQFVLPREIRLKEGKRMKDYGKVYEGELYLLKQKSELLCPILVFLQSNQAARCFFDPFCLQQVKSINWNQNCQQKQQIESKEQKIRYQIQITKSKSEIYLLLGPEALTRAKQALQKLSISNIFDPKNTILMSNIIHVNCQNEQSLEIKKPMMSAQINAKIIDTYNPNDNKKMRQIFFQSISPKKAQNNQQQQMMSKNQKFWSFYDQLARSSKLNQANVQYQWKITNRSKYTHKRRNKLTKEEKKKTIAQQNLKRQMKTQKTPEKNMNSSEKIFNERSEKIEQKSPIQLKNVYQNNIKCDPIMIAPFMNFDSIDSMYKGCFVLCSNQQNCILWRALSQTNVKVIGRKQLRHCTFEAGLRFFPDDYVEAKGFQKYNRARSIQLIDRQKRLSFQKRIDYLKINSPFPFYFYLSENKRSQISNISVSMLSRGRCFSGSYICKLNQQDQNKIINQIERKGNIKSIVVEQQKQMSDVSSIEVDYKTKTYEEIIKIISDANCNKSKRNIIGFLTYGGFRQSQCRQAGVGFVIQEEKSLNVGKSHQNEYVLIRKPSSKFYYAAILRRI